MRIVLTVLVGATVLNCGGEAPRLRVSQRDSAGIRIVESKAPVWSDTAGWTLDSVPGIQIESDPDGLGYFLYGVAAIQLTGDGTIFVANRGTEQLLVFDSLGGFLETVGRPGEGPGEFFSVFDMFRCAGDTLLVYEGVRASIFDAQGRFVRTVLVAGRLAEGRGNVEGVSADCSAILVVDGTYRPPSPGQGIHRLPSVLHWSSLGGGSRDTVLAFPGVEAFPWNMRGQMVSMWLPFGREPVWAVGDDRVYFGSSDGFEISAFDRRGQLREIIRWAAKPVPVTDADWDGFKEGYADFYAEDPPGINTPPEDFPRPDRKPAYGGLLVDDRGYLWVREYRHSDAFPPLPDEAEGAWWIFDQDGRWLGRVRTPIGLRVLGVQRDYVVGVVRDELDVESVQLYHLIR